MTAASAWQRFDDNSGDDARRSHPASRTTGPQQIYGFIVREAPREADPFIDGLLDAIESLSTMSERGATPRDDTLKQQGYRFLVHGNFLVLYKVMRRQVRGYRVLRGSRAYRSLL